MICYGVATTPRTGGNFLDSLLRNRGLGDPTEHCHSDYAMEPIEDLWDTNVLGIRFHWTARDWGRVVDFDEAFPPGQHVTWIHLVRGDTDAQARSYLTAMKTGIWHKPSTPYATDLDEREVDYCSRRLQRMNDDWVHWFKRKGIIPACTLKFENLENDPTRYANALSKLILGGG